MTENIHQLLNALSENDRETYYALKSSYNNFPEDNRTDLSREDTANFLVHFLQKGKHEILDSPNINAIGLACGLATAERIIFSKLGIPNNKTTLLDKSITSSYLKKLFDSGYIAIEKPIHHFYLESIMTQKKYHLITLLGAEYLIPDDQIFHHFLRFISLIIGEGGILIISPSNHIQNIDDNNYYREFGLSPIVGHDPSIGRILVKRNNK